MHTFRWQLRDFYFSPDEGGSPGGEGGTGGVSGSGAGAGNDPGQAGSSQTAGTGAVASHAGGAGAGTTPPASAIPGSPGQQPGSPGAAGGQGAPGSFQPPAWLSKLKESGIGEFQDETTALAAIQQLHRTNQQFQQISPWVQAYQQHAAPFAQYIQSIRERQAQGSVPSGQQVPQQGGQGKPWWSQHWNPPEFNPQWASMLTQDEQGNLQPRPGTPPEIVAKYQQYQQFRSEQAQRLMNNPYEFMEPAIKQLAREEAQAIVREQMGGYSDQQRSNQFVQENSQWLYQFDQSGQRMAQPVHNPMTGQMQMMPVLSQWGQLFAEETQREATRQAQRGYSDVEEQKRLAMQSVQLQYLVSQLRSQQTQPGQQQPAQQQLSPQQQANQRFLQQNNPPAQQPAVPGNQQPRKRNVTARNLKDAMLEDLKSAGINDEVLNNAFLGRK